MVVALTKINACVKVQQWKGGGGDLLSCSVPYRKAFGLANATTMQKKKKTELQRTSLMALPGLFRSTTVHCQLSDRGEVSFNFLY